jgi:RNA polymerase sigma factor (sigma-70 family)
MLSVETLFDEARLPSRVRSLAASLSEEEIRRLIAQQIDRLPERQRLALALRFYESLGPSEIACVLDIGEERAKTLLLEATRALSEKLRNAASPDPRRRARSKPSTRTQRRKS